MMDVFLSFVPYILVFLFCGTIDIIALFKERHKKDDPEEWRKIKSENTWTAFKAAMSFSIMVCAYTCVRADGLGIGTRIFVIIWGLWSIYSYMQRKEQ